MASSQVEIPSSSPFGCVLRDHTTIQNNMKNFVIDHINTCNISISSDPTLDQDTEKPGRNNETWASRVVQNNLGSLSFKRRNHHIYNEKEDSSSLSALVSPRHSKTIDRWAAKQAREMMSSTLENEVDVLENSSKSEISNLGASSLVQIWEKRLNKFDSTKPNAPTTVGRTSSPKENAVFVEQEEQQCIVSEQNEIIDEPPQSNNEESIQDCESDKSCSPKAPSSSDGVESERGKVAYIIKRLIASNQMQSKVSMSGDNGNNMCNTMTGSLYRENNGASTPEQPEHRAFVQVTSSTRIRGRHAFNNLLMQFESDRHGELHNLAERGVVSKFTQRGRIQSVLRLRLLQREVSAQDQCNQKPPAYEVYRQPQGSAIMQLRERFSIGFEHRTSVITEHPVSRSRSRQIVDNNTQLDSFPTQDQFMNDTHRKTIYGTAKERAHPSSDVIFQGTCCEVENNEPKETIVTSCSVASLRDQQHVNTNSNYDAMEEEEEEEEECRQQYDASCYINEIEREEDSDQNYDEAGDSYDWISLISRPRSYWEERRQEWYKEMLHYGSDNDERRKLLERKTVSTFLSSDFRERMDSLMKCHMRKQTHLVTSQYDEEDNEESMCQLMAFFQEHLRPRKTTQEDGRDIVEEEAEMRNEKEIEKAGEIITSSLDHEFRDYYNQSTSSMPTPTPSTWSYRDNEAGDDYERAASISSPLPSQSQFFHRDDSQQYSSSTNHHSIEMEFIYDMRRQMDQLFHEVFELRKSVKSCIDVQMQLQESKEVHTEKEEEEEEKEEKRHSKTPKKGNCCICFEKKVNSLFYRCGHMCACLKCADELQWNSGKCPICRASVVDVVQVFAK